jgi:hypothetical protein
MLFFWLPEKNRSVQISLPPVMSFCQLCRNLDVLMEDVYVLGEVAGIVACQAVPSLEIWVLENWSKGDVLIPLEVQRLYDEAVDDLYQRPELIKLQ